MGALGGLIRFDQGQVDASRIHTLATQLARRGPDDPIIANAGSVAFVYRPYGATTDELTRSSLWQSARGAWLAFDGRLDNGPELARALGLSGSDAQRDSAILLEGFERHGTSFVEQIVGDFALAYWDPSSRRVTLARDVAAVRTLYYHAGPQSFTFATDLGGLVMGAGVDRTLDDDYIAAYLANYASDESSTIYRHVRALEPAHVMTVTLHGQISTRRFWELPCEAELLRFGRDEDYVDQFRTLFLEAVRVRMRTNRPVVAELSGGIDSSSVVCVAAHLLEHGQVLAPSLSTASRILDRSKTNDQKFRAVVEQLCHLEHFHHMESEASIIAAPKDPASLHVLSLLSATAGWETALCCYLRRQGAYTVLSGFAGDEMFISMNRPQARLGDCLVRGHFHRLHQELTLWSDALRVPYASLLWEGIQESLPRPWMPEVTSPKSWRRKTPPWLASRLRAHAFEDVERLDRRVRRYGLPTQRLHAGSYYDAVKHLARGERQEFDARNITYPCLHRPLVEFLHVVPHEQKLRCGESRSLQRRALKHILPKELLLRRGKGQTNELFPHKFRWGWLSEHPLVDSYGYVDAQRAKLAAYRVLSRNSGDRVPLAALALEVWLRAHDGHDPARANGHAVAAANATAPPFWARGQGSEVLYEFPELTNVGTVEWVVR